MSRHDDADTSVALTAEEIAAFWEYYRRLTPGQIVNLLFHLLRLCNPPPRRRYFFLLDEHGLTLL